MSFFVASRALHAHQRPCLVCTRTDKVFCTQTAAHDAGQPRCPAMKGLLLRLLYVNRRACGWKICAQGDRVVALARVLQVVSSSFVQHSWMLTRQAKTEQAHLSISQFCRFHITTVQQSPLLTAYTACLTQSVVETVRQVLSRLSYCSHSSHNTIVLCTGPV
jgi:hypothetical protein